MVVGTVSQNFWPLRRISHSGNDCGVDTFVELIDLGIIECCRCEWIFDSWVDYSTVSHCDELSTHVY